MANEVSKITTGSDKRILFFDGVCNLCNKSVLSVIRYDTKHIFYFSSLQSDFAQKFFKEKNFAPSTDSMIYWNGNKFFERSAAVLKISRHLKFPVRLLAGGWILPKKIRDACYSFIAKRRYRWFGRREVCMVPTPELKNRFLE